MCFPNKLRYAPVALNLLIAITTGIINLKKKWRLAHLHLEMLKQVSFLMQMLGQNSMLFCLKNRTQMQNSIHADFKNINLH